MTVLLKDGLENTGVVFNTTGGAELIECLAAASGDLGLAFAGEPNHRVRAHLDRALVTMERGLAEELGATMAAKIVAALKHAVLAQKAKLEALGMGRA